eukprot:gene18918-25479_t
MTESPMAAPLLTRPHEFKLSFTDPTQEGTAANTSAANEETENDLPRVQALHTQWKVQKVAAIFVISYLALSVLAFHFLEDWDILTCIYFAIITITTVGYGDVAPKTDTGEIFGCFYALLGLGLVVGFLSVFYSWIDAKRQAAVDITSEISKMSMMAILGEESKAEAECELILKNKKKEKEAKRLGLGGCLGMCDRIREVWNSYTLLRAGLPMMIWIIIGALFIGRFTGREWGFIDSFYFAVATCTTIGYGDIYPDSWQGQLFAIFYVPLAVLSVGNALAEISSLWLNKQVELNEASCVNNVQLNINSLGKMDDDGDLSVDKFDFACYMLKHMKKVEPELLEMIENQFHRLDRDGSGRLDKEDVWLMGEELQGAASRLNQLNLDLLKPGASKGRHQLRQCSTMA